VFYYGAAKSHCAVYGAVPAGFEADLAAFPRSKGAIRFQPDAPLPAALVRRLVKARVAANRAGNVKPPAKHGRRPA
ncbi:MAG: hypothetical protein LC620_02675, partial [Halobacteriales archaeon]|nr:hypothetical protein [Halobacteriales archaeon]